MTAALAHRGPDGEGFHESPAAAFGHRRLAILDPEGGAQPMASADGNAVIVHNGEIYNTPELRRGLAADGLSPRSHSDTEVLVEGLARHGENYLERLNGIFAFAWHDRRRRLTLIARDPIGVKPLYYHRDDRRLLFASEIRALLANPAVERRLDPDELAVLLALRYNPAPGTLLRGIRKVLPGHYLRVEAGRVEEIAFDRWAPSAPVAGGPSFDQCVTAYDEALERTVLGQMLSDVPVGAFLSGGLDSTAVATVLGASGKAGPTFTVGFKDPDRASMAVDEREAARRTAALLGLEHQEEIVGPDAFAEALPEVIGSIEEPVGSASAVPFWFLSRRAARTVKVVLTGQGADEPHGGYPRYQGVLLARGLGRFVPVGAARALASRLRGRRDRLRRGLTILGERDPAALLLRTYRHFSPDQVSLLVRPAWRGNPDLAGARIETWRRRVDHLDPLGQMLYVDSRVWLADDLLLYGDKLSMAHGLEVRVPFLDRDLMRQVEAFPTRYRVGLRRPKRLHRAALEHRLPAHILARPKQGFDTPVDRWFRTLWLPRLPEWLWGRDAFLPSILHPEGVQRIVAEHRDGVRDHQRRLYTLLALEFWGRRFLR